MAQTIAITRQWQIHIPKAIREAIGMDEPGVAEIEVENNKIIITPKKSGILALAGKYHHLYKKKPINIENIRDVIDYSDL